MRYVFWVRRGEQVDGSWIDAFDGVEGVSVISISTKPRVVAQVESSGALESLRARLGSKIGVEPLKGYGAS